VKKALVGSLILMCAARAVAADVVCTSKIDAVYVEQGGNVVVRGTAAGSAPYAGWQLLCNLKRPDSVGPNVCSTWLATAAQALGEQPTTIVLQTVYQNYIGTCAGIPALFLYPMSVVMLR
jgi:hypothetical protein